MSNKEPRGTQCIPSAVGHPGQMGVSGEEVIMTKQINEMNKEELVNHISVLDREIVLHKEALVSKDEEIVGLSDQLTQIVDLNNLRSNHITNAHAFIKDLI